MLRETNETNASITNLHSPDPTTSFSRGCMQRVGGKGKPKWTSGRQFKDRFFGKSKEINGQVFQLQVEYKGNRNSKLL